MFCCVCSCVNCLFIQGLCVPISFEISCLSSFVLVEITRYCVRLPIFQHTQTHHTYIKIVLDHPNWHCNPSRNNAPHKPIQIDLWIFFNYFYETKTNSRNHKQAHMFVILAIYLNSASRARGGEEDRWGIARVKR